jgi:hypothetical protein
MVIRQVPPIIGSMLSLEGVSQQSSVMHRFVVRKGRFTGRILMDGLYQTWTAQTCGGPERP